MKFASSAYLEAVGRACFLDAHADVRFYFFEKTIPKVARCDILALFSRKRAVVYHEHHADSRFVYVHERQRLNTVNRACGFADAEICDTGHGNDIAGRSGFGFNALEALETIKPRNFYFPVAVGAAEHCRLVALNCAAHYSADTYAPYIVVIVYC